jgi:hypothetical protein
MQRQKILHKVLSCKCYSVEIVTKNMEIYYICLVIDALHAFKVVGNEEKVG